MEISLHDVKRLLRMGTEQNLLYGILAWRAGFVSRDDLLKSLRAWTGDRSQPLAQNLVETEVLTEERRQIVSRLVDEHLALHHGDAAASLAALEDTATLRDEIARIVGGNGHQTLPQFSATLPGPSAPMNDAEAADASAAEGGALRFQILRPHARGALGEVFVARDDELNREVALKRIRDHHVDTPQNRARFLLEAEVTGGLEHPGIVPVYSLGTSDDGRPFYAMRLIKGRSLREAIDHYHSPDAAHANAGERLLELRQLLDRFLAVCNAIEYAHSRGVLHRDLKPENIMLGAYGETLVVDWGLAKPLAGADSARRDVDCLPAFEEDAPATRAEAAAGGLADQTQTVDEPLWRPSASSSATQMGSALGTPSYMSPEQAAGRLDDIGRASDVYSLGATLYCLLTGRPPFNDTQLGRLLDRVRRGDFPPPRSVSRAVPAALEAVCLKAMALDPAERYATPQALAGDVERWLADEPVSAYGAPWHERLAHWARRHRRGVQSGVAALAVISAVSIAASLLVHSAKLQVERERIAERDAKEEARRAIDNFVNLVTEEPALNDASLRHLRQRLLADALTYYEELIDKHGGEEHLRHELAGAILRVGRINHRTGFNGEALKAFQEALKLFEELAARHPDREQYQSELAATYKDLGLLEREAGDWSAALTFFEQAQRVKQVLVDREPNNPAYRNSLAAALADAAEALQAIGRDDQSGATYERAIAEQRRALEDDPRNARYEQSLGHYRQRLEALGGQRRKDGDR